MPHHCPSNADEVLQCGPSSKKAELVGPLLPFSDQQLTSDSNRCVPARVAYQARKDPNALAIKDGDELLSYGELAARSRELACHLRRRGINRNDVVGVCAERSIASIVGALGIMTAGAAYLPLDPSHPVERLASQFRDAGGKFLLTAERAKPTIAGEAEQVTLDGKGCLRDRERIPETILEKINPDTLAYVIYTSGSTGEPKGVEITHGNLLNLVDWHQEAFAVIESDRASHLAAVAFDAAVWETWPYLSAGASVHVASNAALQEPEALREWLLREKITLSFAPTILAEQLMELAWPKGTSLRFLLAGGDVLRSYPLSRIPFPVVNNYGPTECTVVATSIVLKPSVRSQRLPTIGKPIANVNIYILDENEMPLEKDEIGEIWIGGYGVARGYRNRPDLTAERFRMTALARGKADWSYRTGDRGRLLPDGQIEFLGRIDEQIKIRGFRVEPGEVEARLKEHPWVQDCAVAAIEELPGDRTLMVYIVPRSQLNFRLDEVRAYLAERLPDALIPGKYVVIERLPLTPNGKIDRMALRAMNPSATPRDKLCTTAGTATEARLAEIVAPLLKLGSVGVRDNFFLLGGHSLLGTQLIARLRKVFGVDVSLRYLFEHPTISEIASEVDRRQLVRSESPPFPEDEKVRRGNLTAAPKGI